jgi:hypothetical protein
MSSEATVLSLAPTGGVAASPFAELILAVTLICSLVMFHHAMTVRDDAKSLFVRSFPILFPLLGVFGILILLRLDLL